MFSILVCSSCCAEFNSTMEKIKIRGKNLKEDEKEILTNIILNHKNVIENKKTDCVSVSAKNDAWNQIMEEFNCAYSARPRTVQQLKVFYKNAKSDLKKQLAQNRAEIFKTGGGKSSTTLDENNPLLAVVLEQTFSIQNDYDSSNALFETSVDKEVSSSPPLLEESDHGTEEIEIPPGIENLSTNPQEDNGESVDLLLPSTSSAPRRTKRNQNRQQAFHEETAKAMLEIADLKKRKLEAEIKKHQAKTEVYKKKLDILKKMDCLLST